MYIYQSKYCSDLLSVVYFEENIYDQTCNMQIKTIKTVDFFYLLLACIN